MLLGEIDMTGERTSRAPILWCKYVINSIHTADRAVYYTGWYKLRVVSWPKPFPLRGSDFHQISLARSIWVDHSTCSVAATISVISALLSELIEALAGSNTLLRLGAPPKSV